MFSVGFDIGSSSIKCSIFDMDSGEILGKGFYPSHEMEIISPKPGWAEQSPDIWWQYTKLLLKKIVSDNKIDSKKIKAIGISYQMHGLVMVDKEKNVLHNSIIWCDSRAVEIGEQAFDAIGHNYCLKNLLNSPGNFTASKLRWIKENEPEIFKKIYKILLPGDFIAMKFTGEINTTIPGLSEGIFWDFKKDSISKELLFYYNISEDLIPNVIPTFANQGRLLPLVAEELNLSKDVIVSYRAGDQPNNALALGVTRPGQIAANAGTSGVIYGVTNEPRTDPYSRVNQFAHVNYSENKTIGILLCINGVGIQNSWLKKNLSSNLHYEEMNKLAGTAPIGSDGIISLPFGNGSERILQNKNIGAHLLNMDFNQHNLPHIIRATQEGIAFAFNYGIEIMKKMEVKIENFRAGWANLFLSPVFSQTLANITETRIELYNSSGAYGAAFGAAIGIGQLDLAQISEFGLRMKEQVNPQKNEITKTLDSYSRWSEALDYFLK